MGGKQREQGSVTVEMAGVLAVLAMLGLVLVQIVLVLDGYLVAGQAAREAARAAVLGMSDQEVAATVRDWLGDGAQIQIEPSVRAAGDIVTVSVRVEVARIPFLARALPSLWIDTRAAMRAEVAVEEEP